MISCSSGKLRRVNSDQCSVPLYEMCGRLPRWKFRKDTLVESTHDGPSPVHLGINCSAGFVGDPVKYGQKFIKNVPLLPISFDDSSLK